VSSEDIDRRNLRRGLFAGCLLELLMAGAIGWIVVEWIYK
jgi:hypothetical protein